VGYDIFFVWRAPGKSWEDAFRAVEENTGRTEVLSSPRHWDQVVCGVREILGDVPVLEDPSAGRSMIAAGPRSR